MSLNLATRRRLNLTRAQVPNYLEAWSETFPGCPNEDEQHEALVDDLRDGADDRSELFEVLRNALPPDARSVLVAFDEAWSRQAAAREEAAYVIGAVIGQTRPICCDCQGDRRRAAAVASTWRRYSGLAARVSR